jgi:hypothetical protein
MNGGRVKASALLPLALVADVWFASTAVAVEGSWMGPTAAVGRWEVTGWMVVDRDCEYLGTCDETTGIPNFRSFLTFQASRRPAGSWVMYDPERWDATPLREQRHPRRYMRLFVAEAHARGLFAILAPALGLPGPDLECSPNEFLSCGYLQIPADIFLLQSQRLECDLEAFTRLVRGASRRSASPLYVELTVRWRHVCVTPQVVHDAWYAARPYADGFALWGTDTNRTERLGRRALDLIEATQAA